MKFAEVKRHSLVEDVCNQLVSVIRNETATVDGQLPSERQLATQLGVSRPVVREATKRLELQGLIEIRHGLGIRVIDRLYEPVSAAAKLLLPDETERLRQSLEVRATLEPQIARRAAERVSKQSLIQLKKIHQSLESATVLEEAMEADLAFHSELVRISGNEIFGLMLDSIADLGRDSRRATMNQAGYDRAIQQHAAVLRSVERENANAAEKAMRSHIHTAIDDLSATLNP